MSKPAILQLRARTISVLLIASCAVNPGAPASSAKPDWVAFVSNRDGNNEIYIASSGGTQIRNLTNNPASDIDPAWSPDGTSVIFVSDRTGHSEIYQMGADGTGVMQLASCPGDKNYPKWSPDGESIAFSIGENLYLMASAGGAATKLFKGFGHSWSLDGSALLCSEGQLAHMVVKDITGGDSRGLGHGKVEEMLNNERYDFLFCVAPRVSPDGRTILFTRANSEEQAGASVLNYEIYTMRRDGSERRQLTVSPGRDFGLGWSHDGRRVIFDSDRDGNLEIYTMNADGTNQVNLTKHDGADWGASWSPAVVR